MAHAERLAADGADVLDLGPSSSNPDGGSVGAPEEIRRLDPVITALHDAGRRVSIDSPLDETQRFGLARGVAFLNDIRAFPDAEIYPALAAADCGLVVMHSIQQAVVADRREMAPSDVIEGMFAFFARRISRMESAGISRRRLVLDPGMGFFLGANPEPSLAAMAALPRLRAEFGCPVLVSVSRKSFLGALTGRGVGQRGAATLAAELACARLGADWIRTHDVAGLRDGLTIEARVSSFHIEASVRR